MHIVTAYENGKNGAAGLTNASHDGSMRRRLKIKNFVAIFGVFRGRLHALALAGQCTGKTLCFSRAFINTSTHTPNVK